MIIKINENREIFEKFQKSLKNLKCFGDLFEKDTEILKDCLIEEMRMYDEAIKLLQDTRELLKYHLKKSNK